MLEYTVTFLVVQKSEVTPVSGLYQTDVGLINPQGMIRENSLKMAISEVTPVRPDLNTGHQDVKKVI